VVYFKKCIELDPGDIDKDFKGQIAELYESLNKMPEAINYYK
jgi:hypothetical protein